MNRKVKRYDPINSDGTCGMCIEDADYGAYVEYADYAALEAELAKLRLVQGVNQQLLEALTGMLLHIREPESESEFQWPGHFKKQKAAFAAAHAAIATARQEGGKV